MPQDSMFRLGDDGHLYLDGYCERRILAGDIPEYRKPGFIPPGMGGLPEVRITSMVMESSIVTALRRAAEKNKP